MAQAKDYTGQKIHRFILLSPTNNRRNGSIMWRAQCECGKIIEILPRKISPNSSCGCLTVNLVKPEAGLKIHKITFIRPTNKRKDRKVIWEAICDCGNVTYVLPYKVISGNTTSCGCIAQDTQRNTGELSRKYHPMKSTAMAVWRANYKDSDFEVFVILSRQPCYYCGILPSRTKNLYHHYKNGVKKNGSKLQLEEGNFTWNGLDRIDCSIGHVVGNIIPCCTTCNRMKMDLGLEEFLRQIYRINCRVAFLHGVNIPEVPLDIERFLSEARAYVLDHLQTFTIPVTPVIYNGSSQSTSVIELLLQNRT